MPAPAFAGEIVEALGLVVGLVDLSFNLSETPQGVLGIPVDEPYVKVDRLDIPLVQGSQR